MDLWNKLKKKILGKGKIDDTKKFTIKMKEEENFTYRIDVELEKIGWIVHGNVRDKKDKKPLENVKVTLDGNEKLTDSEGNYKFVDIEEGSHKISFSLRGYKTFEKDFSLPP